MYWFWVPGRCIHAGDHCRNLSHASVVCIVGHWMTNLFVKMMNKMVQWLFIWYISSSDDDDGDIVMGGSVKIPCMDHHLFVMSTCRVCFSHPKETSCWLSCLWRLCGKSDDADHCLKVRFTSWTREAIARCLVWDVHCWAFIVSNMRFHCGTGYAECTQENTITKNIEQKNRFW